jgi:hypothetical protein
MGTCWSREKGKHSKGGEDIKGGQGVRNAEDALIGLEGPASGESAIGLGLEIAAWRIAGRSTEAQRPEAAAYTSIIE